MPQPDLDIVNKFFEAYSNHNLDALRLVMDDEVTWISLGQPSNHVISKGFDEVIAFLDQLGAITSQSNNRVEKLIMSAEDGYVVECLRVRTNLEEGENLDQLVCVLWKIENSKIVEGRHFFADPEAADSVITYISTFQ